MRTHSDIIGGNPQARLIAAAVDRPLNTVRSWGQRNYIPGEFWKAIADAGFATLDELAHGATARLSLSSQTA